MALRKTPYLPNLPSDRCAAYRGRKLAFKAIAGIVVTSGYRQSTAGYIVGSTRLKNAADTMI